MVRNTSRAVNLSFKNSPNNSNDIGIRIIQGNALIIKVERQVKNVFRKKQNKKNCKCNREACNGDFANCYQQKEGRHRKMIESNFLDEILKEAEEKEQQMTRDYADLMLLEIRDLQVNIEKNFEQAEREREIIKQWAIRKTAHCKLGLNI
jgi:hypothetical protein